MRNEDSNFSSSMLPDPMDGHNRRVELCLSKEFSSFLLFLIFEHIHGSKDPKDKRKYVVCKCIYPASNFHK